jgi:hypothetical protein
MTTFDIPLFPDFEGYFGAFGSKYKLRISFDVIGAAWMAMLGVLFLMLNRNNRTAFDDAVSVPVPPAPGIGVRRGVTSRIRVAVHRWGQWVVLSLLTLGAFFYYQRGIAFFDFSNDEFQVVDTAYGYLQTGRLIKWNFCAGRLSSLEYLRAFPHTWLVAQAIDLLGMNEWATRLVSVLFGVATVLLGYAIACTFIRDKRYVFLLMVGLILHPDLSKLFKITRMYSMLVPFFLALFICVHRLVVVLYAEGAPAFKRPAVIGLTIGTALLIAANGIIHIN